MLASQLPVVLKFALVQLMPLSNQRQRPSRKLARHDRPRFNIKHSFKLSIDGVEMRATVLSIENPHHDSKKPTQHRHEVRISYFADRGKRIPAGYVGEVKDTVAAVRFLLSDEARYVNGTNIHVSGAWGI